MFKRPLFWLGLLFGGFTAFRSFTRRATALPSVSLEWISDLTGDVVVSCDAAGAIVKVNAAAQSLFGADGAGMTSLCYPTGQGVPEGQLPLSRALRTGRGIVGTGYRCWAMDGSVHILDVWARSLPEGGAAAVFREVTALHDGLVRENQSKSRHLVVQTLCRRLTKAGTAGEIGRAVVESVHSLLDAVPNVQVRLYLYTPSAQTLTRLASEPEDLPKRPKSSAQMPPVFPFDVQVPALWQLYIARQPWRGGLPAPGEKSCASAYALPLLTNGAALGHLTLTSSASEAFDDPAQQEMLESLASIAALALTLPQSADLATALQVQADAVREIAQAVAGGLEHRRLADLISGRVRHVTGSEVCTLSVPAGGKLSVVGTAFRDDLLFPDRITPIDLVLHPKAVQKAWRTQKTALQLGVTNPSFETGPWRAFAGRAGQHSVTAVPLTSRQGVITVYNNGASPLPDAQIKFLETIAAVIAIGLTQASVPEASSSSV